MTKKMSSRILAILLALVGFALANAVDRYIGFPVLVATASLAFLFFLARQIWQSIRPELTDLPYRLAWGAVMGAIGLAGALVIYSLYGQMIARFG